MSYYLRSANVTADGDIISPEVSYYGEDDQFRNTRGVLLHHISVADQTGAATPLAELWGGSLASGPGIIFHINIASPGIVTTVEPHGLSNGQRVFLSGTDGDIGDVSGIVAGATSRTFNIGVNTTALGSRGQIHVATSIMKLTNFGATSLGGAGGIGPFVGVYVDTNANNRVDVLYRDMG